MDFGGLISRDHPEINKENYSEYVDLFYKENEHELQEKLLELNKSIFKTESIFFSVVKKIFSNDYSNNKYIGSLSIFDCNPRYLDNETFQIFYRRGPLNKRKVAYHEILHFIFFDYCDTYLSDFTAVSNISYSWRTGDYGQCNDTCGGGKKTRVVECIRSTDSQVVNDSYCNGTKPDTISYDCPPLGPSRLCNDMGGEVYE